MLARERGVVGMLEIDSSLREARRRQPTLGSYDRLRP